MPNFAQEELLRKLWWVAGLPDGGLYDTPGEEDVESEVVDGTVTITQNILRELLTMAEGALDE